MRNKAVVLTATLLTTFGAWNAYAANYELTCVNRAGEVVATGWCDPALYTPERCEIELSADCTMQYGAACTCTIPNALGGVPSEGAEAPPYTHAPLGSESDAAPGKELYDDRPLGHAPLGGNRPLGGSLQQRPNHDGLSEDFQEDDAAGGSAKRGIILHGKGRTK